MVLNGVTFSSLVDACTKHGETEHPVELGSDAHSAHGLRSADLDPSKSDVLVEVTIEGKSGSKVTAPVVEGKAAQRVGAEPDEKDSVEVQPVYQVEGKSDSKIITAVVEGKAAQRIGAEPAESAGCPGLQRIDVANCQLVSNEGLQAS